MVNVFYTIFILYEIAFYASIVVVYARIANNLFIRDWCAVHTWPSVCARVNGTNSGCKTGVAGEKYQNSSISRINSLALCVACDCTDRFTSAQPQCYGCHAFSASMAAEQCRYDTLELKCRCRKNLLSQNRVCVKSAILWANSHSFENRCRTRSDNVINYRCHRSWTHIYSRTQTNPVQLKVFLGNRSPCEHYFFYSATSSLFVCRCRK